MSEVNAENSIPFAWPLALPGPMEGVMHSLYCRAASELNLFPCWITPFLRVSTGVPGKAAIGKFLKPFLDTGIPVILQLMGVSPQLLAETAAATATFNLAGINLNFACPSGQVLSSGAGGALLKSPQMLNQITEMVGSVCPDNRSFSVKIRSGYCSPDEIYAIIPALTNVSRKPDYIIMHYRTVSEKYLHVPDAFRRFVEAAAICNPIPLIANGDIVCHDDATRILQQSGSTGVMAARGILQDPFLIARINHQEHEFPNPSAGRNIFFNRMLDLAAANPSQYRCRSKFIELANFMWGGKSEEFKRLLRLADDELFSMRLPLT